eukprot:1865765-Prymnesium_polylepis.1
MELDAYGTLTVPEPEGVCVYKQVFALFSFAAFVIIGSITCMVRATTLADARPTAAGASSDPASDDAPPGTSRDCCDPLRTTSGA